MRARVGTSPAKTRIQPDSGESAAAPDSATISFRLQHELLAELDAKARDMSLTRSSVIILGINQLLGRH